MKAARHVVALFGGVVGIVASWVAPAAADVPGAGIVKDAVGGGAGWAFGGVASAIASWVMGAVGDLVGGVVGYLGDSARPGLDAAWFSGPGSPFSLVRNIAGTLLIGFVLLAVIQGLLSGELTATFARLGRDLVIAVIGMSAVVVMTVKLLDLTDALSAAVLQGADAQALRFLSGFAWVAGPPSGGLGMILVGLVVALGALLVWLELLVRSALVYLLVALSPLAFAAATWPGARGVLRRTVELLVAVVVSKFVICVAVALGAAALGGAGSAPSAGGPVPAASLGTLLSGAAVLGLAAFSPFVVLRLIPFAEAAAAGQGVSRSPMRGAQAGAMALYSAQSLTRLAGTGAFASAGIAHQGPGGSASQAPPGPGRMSGTHTRPPAGRTAPGGAEASPTSAADAAAAQGRVGSRGEATPRPSGSSPDNRSHPPLAPPPPRPGDGGAPGHDARRPR